MLFITIGGPVISKALKALHSTFSSNPSTLMFPKLMESQGSQHSAGSQGFHLTLVSLVSLPLNAPWNSYIWAFSYICSSVQGALLPHLHLVVSSQFFENLKLHLLHDIFPAAPPGSCCYFFWTSIILAVNRPPETHAGILVFFPWRPYLQLDYEHLKTAHV